METNQQQLRTNVVFYGNWTDVTPVRWTPPKPDPVIARGVDSDGRYEFRLLDDPMPSPPGHVKVKVLSSPDRKYVADELIKLPTSTNGADTAGLDGVILVDRKSFDFFVSRSRSVLELQKDATPLYCGTVVTAVVMIVITVWLGRVADRVDALLLAAKRKAGPK